MLSIFSNLDQKSHEVISFLLIACLPVAARGAASKVRRVPPAIITYTTCVGVKGCSIDTHTHIMQLGPGRQQQQQASFFTSVFLTFVL